MGTHVVASGSRPQHGRVCWSPSRDRVVLALRGAPRQLRVCASRPAEQGATRRGTDVRLRPTVLVLVMITVKAGLTGMLAAQQNGAEPDSLQVQALMQEATLHMAEDRWAEAAEAWSRVITVSPAHVVAYLNRAMSYYKVGNCERRESDARSALEILGEGTFESEGLESLVYRAQAHAHLMDLDQAIRLLEEAQREHLDSRPAGILLNQMRRRAAGTSTWHCPAGGA